MEDSKDDDQSSEDTQPEVQSKKIKPSLKKKQSEFTLIKKPANSEKTWKQNLKRIKSQCKMNQVPHLQLQTLLLTLHQTVLG